MSNSYWSISRGGKTIAKCKTAEEAKQYCERNARRRKDVVINPSQWQNPSEIYTISLREAGEDGKYRTTSKELYTVILSMKK